MMAQELDKAKNIYDKHMASSQIGDVPVHKNQAKVAGGLRWAQELRQRIQVPMEGFKHLEHPCLDSQEGKDVFVKYEEMLELLAK